jgi:hypothetical protein
MGLDKLKKKKKPHQLVSKRKDGKRPGYYGPDAGHANDPGSSANDSGGGDGGGDDYMNYYSPPAPAPAPAPAPTFDYESEAYDTTPAASYSEPDTSGDTADFAFTTPSPKPDTSGDDQEEDVARMMVDMGLTPDNAPTVSTLPDAEDDGDTGESLYVSPTQTMKDEEPYIDYKPGPNYVTADELSNVIRGTGDSDERAATLARIQAVNPIQQPTGILQTIGSGLKTAAKVALPFVAAPIAGLVGGKTAFDAVNLGMRARNAYNFASRYAPKTTRRMAEAFTTFQGTGDRRPNTATGYESDGDRLIPKDVVTASVQKYSPELNAEQLNRAILIRDKLQEVAEKGVSLNKENQMTLTALNNLIEQYQVSV